LNILDAMNDGALFGKYFTRNWRGADSWSAWRTFLAALFALPMDAEALEVYQKHTGRITAPTTPFQEAYCVVGRRGGKSRIAALIGTYLSAFRSYDEYLAPGERGSFVILAADKAQAKNILNYIDGFFTETAILARMVLNRTAESIELSNRIEISVQTSSYRSIRGRTLIGCVGDELAFWRDDTSANPDVEVLNAVRPGLVTIPNSVLLCISSAYSKRGALWTAHKENFGKDGSPVLVWKGSSREMNPRISALTVAAAYMRDASSARSEFGAEFRDDIESLFSAEVVEQRVVKGRRELPPVTGLNYRAFCDPSGGVSDSFVLAIGHKDEKQSIAVLDFVREIVPPFSPEGVVAEFCEVLKGYRLSEVTGDAYAATWPREQFEKRSIRYRVAEKTRSEIYLDFLPLVMSGQCELLDNPRLIAQLCGLERRTGRTGKDSVDHTPGAHDDVCNAASGVLVEVLGGPGELGLLKWFAGLVGGTYPLPEEPVITPRDDGIGKLETLRFEQKLLGITPVPTSEMHEPEAVPPCPSCAAVCVTRIGGVGWRCGQCAHTWDGPKNPSPPNRHDITSGRFSVRTPRRW
jgi:hypothetical protein